MPKEPLVVLIYHPDDKELVQGLKSFLKPEVRASKLNLWDEWDILPGQEVRASIKDHIDQADIIVVLFSQTLLADDARHEHALCAHGRLKGAYPFVIPVVLKACNLGGTGFEGLGKLPKDGRSVVQWEHTEEAWLQIATVVLDCVSRISEQRAPCADVADDVQPRVLLAGPYFGLRRASWHAVAQRLHSGLPGAAGDVLDGHLEEMGTCVAHMAAMLQFDAILDLSPWAAFARWNSSGCRVYLPGAPLPDEIGATQVFTLFDPTQPVAPTVPGDIRRRASHIAPAIGRFVASSVTIAGFDEITVAWAAEAIGLFQTVARVHVPGEDEQRVRDALRQDLPGVDVRLSAKPPDAVPRAIGVNDYRRALRIVAGQVKLAGEDVWRPLREVFVDMEVQRTTPIIWASSAADGRQVPSRTSDQQRALAEETTHRKEHHWRPPDSAIVSARGLVAKATRVLLWGKAGTGKSTLLRQLASGDLVGRFPVWVSRIPQQSHDNECFAEIIARQASHDVYLETASSLREELRFRIESGEAHLFVDGLDEAAPEVRACLPGWLNALPSETRVLLASRPTGALRLGIEEVELLGLCASGPEQMLRAYFGESSWIPEILDALRGLPDGPTWLRTPVLLSLAAKVYEERRNLPRATLDLYDAAIDLMLDRAGRRWPLDKGSARRELATVAARLLAPSEGSPRVEFGAQEIAEDEDRREALRRSGLFIGRDLVRFAHLSLGEYLAALGDIDVAEQRVALRDTLSSGDETTLDVLPMAHAHRGYAALEDLWHEAREHDTPDHRMFRLLLRALGYGGGGAEMFARQRGRAILQEIARRLLPASGRFGDHERALFDDLERAQRLLEPYVRQDAERELSPLIESRGDLGTDTNTLLHDLGLTRSPQRRVSRHWPAVWRQARSLVRQGAGVDDLISMTFGQVSRIRSGAVEILGKYSKYWPVLRPLLDDPEDYVRESAVWALKDYNVARPMIRERLLDDVSRVRCAAVNALSHSEPLAFEAQAISRLLDDLDWSVYRATVHVLGTSPEARPILRKHGWELLDRGKRWILRDVIPVLAEDVEAEKLVSGFLESLDEPFISGDTILALMAVPRWRRVLVDALLAGRAAGKIVRALAITGDGPAKEVLTGVLGHADHEVRLDAALALPDHPAAATIIKQAIAQRGARAFFRRFQYTREDDGEPLPLGVARSRSLASDEDIFEAVHAYVIQQDAMKDSHGRLVAMRLLARLDLAKARSILWQWFDDTRGADSQMEYHRCWVLQTLSSDGESRQRIIASLNDNSSRVRQTAINLLRGAPDAAEAVRTRLEDDDGEVQLVAMDALSDDPAIQAQLMELIALDDEPLRQAAFTTLAAQRQPRERLVEVFRTHAEQIRISAIPALCVSHETRSEVYSCVDDLGSTAAWRVASLLPADAEVRLRVVKAVRSLPRGTIPRGIEWVTELVAGDPDVESYFDELANSIWSASHALPGLAKYPSRRGAIFALTKHTKPNVAAAAIRVLANDEDLAPLLDREISRNDLPGDVLAAWIYAAGQRGRHSERILELIAHWDGDVRIEAVMATIGSPATWPALRAQLERETVTSVKEALLDALADDSEAGSVFSRMLQDPASAVRSRGTRLLRRAPLAPAYPVDAILAVREAMRLASALPPDGSLDPRDSLLRRVSAYVDRPAALHLDHDPELAEALLGWLMARMVWASPEGEFDDGRIWGEMQGPLRRIWNVDETIVIRVAMDAVDLPRERLLHPTHNLMEAWRVARLLTADRPPALVLACADVGFEHLAPPELGPGETIWGPTFFGFRICGRSG